MKVNITRTTEVKTSNTLDLTNGTASNRTYTANFSKAWEISRILIKFSTAQSRNITITFNDGTNDYPEKTENADTSTAYAYTPTNCFGTSSDGLKIMFSQTGGACTATIKIIYRDA
ncbi:hypothetical protein KY346_00720 [Candidatus Woesearchaeota archaeon]|nr:hypothetical protein [Candidatus Woesearchaeota archaeon]